MPPKTAYRACWLIGLWVLACLDLPAQANDGSPVFRQYGLADGLPDRTVYDLLQDRTGYIWMATSQGLVRFDGYRFWRPPGPEEIYGSAFWLQEDSEGRIWYQRTDGTLWRFEGDSIRPWPYNDRILKYEGRYVAKPIGYLIEPSGDVTIALEQAGLLVVAADGRDTLLSFVPPSEPRVVMARYQDQRALFVTATQQERFTPAYEAMQEQRGGSMVYRWKPDQGWVLVAQGRLFLEKVIHGLPLGGDSLLVYRHDQGFALACGERLLWQSALPLKNYTAVNRLPNGALAIGSLDGDRGFYHFADLDAVRRDDYRHYLKGYAVTRVLEDRDGGWWVSTWRDGVFYAPNPGSRVWDRRHGLPYEQIVQLAPTPGDTLYIGMRDGSVAGIRPSDRHRWTLPGHPDLFVLEDLAYDVRHRRLWAGAIFLYIFQNGGWSKAAPAYAPNPVMYNLGAKTIAFSTDGRTGRLAHPHGFSLVGNIAQTTLPVLNYIQAGRTWTSFEDRQGRVWVSAQYGVFWLENDRIVSAAALHPFFAEIGPKCIRAFSDSLLVFGFHNKGVLIGYPDERFAHIGPEQGLPRDQLNAVADGGDGRLWVGSTAGLFAIAQNRQGEWRARRYGPMHGLPAREVNAIHVAPDGALWLGTSQGLCRFEPPRPDTLSRAPMVTGIAVDGQPRAWSQGMRLRHHEDFVRIRFVALNYRAMGAIRYRYRLRPDDNWNYTDNNYIELLKLAPGNYRFEVQAVNEDGFWSKSAGWDFSVQPPWWASGPFRAAIALLVLSGLWGYYRLRLKRLRADLQHTKLIHYLERSALQAQMNPHFLFNCLNAIQGMLRSGRQDEALDYLLAFAHLVRRSLEASARNQISLQEEMALLTDYLKLEKMRFQHRFDYRIETNMPDPESVSLPPLLVQPLAENALLHGFRGLQRQGMLLIRFEREGDNYLRITVRDNGIGLEAVEHNRSHTSRSGSITQRRLELINQSPDLRFFERRTLYDDTGAVAGAEVVLRVQVA